MAQKPNSTDATRLPTDGGLSDIAEYVLDYQVRSDEAEATARLALMDALGCAFYSLGNAQCTRALGPVVPGATLDGGARVPGTRYQLDPVSAAKWPIHRPSRHRAGACRTRCCAGSHFDDGSATERVEIAYPLGHRRRRDEALVPLEEKCRRGLETVLPADRCDELMALLLTSEQLPNMPVDEFVSRLVI
jgi:2-methylcitrate dehydratase PrpD